MFISIVIAAGAIFWQSKQVPQKISPLTWEQCQKVPGAEVLLSYPGKCITPDGRSVNQPITKEQINNIQPPVSVTDSPSPLTWEQCQKVPGAEVLLSYPGKCTTPDGRSVTQPLAKENQLPQENY